MIPPAARSAVGDSPDAGPNEDQAARPATPAPNVSLAPRIGFTPTLAHASTNRTAPRSVSVSVMATAGMPSSAARTARVSGRYAPSFSENADRQWRWTNPPTEPSPQGIEHMFGTPIGYVGDRAGVKGGSGAFEAAGHLERQAGESEDLLPSLRIAAGHEVVGLAGPLPRKVRVRLRLGPLDQLEPHPVGRADPDAVERSHRHHAGPKRPLLDQEPAGERLIAPHRGLHVPPTYIQQVLALRRRRLGALEVADIDHVEPLSRDPRGLAEHPEGLGSHRILRRQVRVPVEAVADELTAGERRGRALRGRLAHGEGRRGPRRRLVGRARGQCHNEESHGESNDHRLA